MDVVKTSIQFNLKQIYSLKQLKLWNQLKTQQEKLVKE